MQHLQKNYLTRLAYLTMVIIGMNQGMAFAQEEKKAFDEGDKIISIGVSNGINNILSTSINQGYYRPAFTPSVTFDYGLKGTRGLLSIGGFASFYKTKFGGGSFNPSSGYNINPDGTYSTTTMTEFKATTFTAGIRLGLHYSTRKWDLYAGTLIGAKISFGEGGDFFTNYYQGTPQNPFEKFIRTDISTPFPTKTTTDIFLSPYAGARYFVTKKVSLNLEVGQYTGNIGFGFKF